MRRWPSSVASRDCFVRLWPTFGLFFRPLPQTGDHGHVSMAQIIQKRLSLSFPSQGQSTRGPSALFSPGALDPTSFPGMGQLFHRSQPKERGSTLDRMHAPKEPVQTIFWCHPWIFPRASKSAPAEARCFPGFGGKIIQKFLGGLAHSLVTSGQCGQNNKIGGVVLKSVWSTLAWFVPGEGQFWQL